MGMAGLLFFGEQDVVLIEEIAKLHKCDKELVEKHYKAMLEAIRKDV